MLRQHLIPALLVLGVEAEVELDDGWGCDLSMLAFDLNFCPTAVQLLGANWACLRLPHGNPSTLAKHFAPAKPHASQSLEPTPLRHVGQPRP